MNQLQKTIVTTAVLFAMAMPAFASAQTSTTSIAALLAQIQALQTQIKALQAQQHALVVEQKDIVKTLARTLKEGVSGDDVRMLQALLASDPSIYPEGTISGYYGKLTALAVKRFQKKHNFEQVGVVGPKTLKKLQQLLEDNPLEVVDVEDDDADDGDDDRGDRQHALRVVCHKVPPGHLVAAGWLKKNDGVKPIVPECQKLPKGIEDILNRNKGTTTPPTPTTTPDTTAPVISALSTSSLTTNSAVVTWTTNEAATSQVYVGTVNPASVGSSTLAQVAGLSLAHSVPLTGLVNGTTYYLIVVSADASGNMTTSGQVSFATLVPDTTAPAISGVTTSSIASTSAVVSWTTNESATGNVYFGTVDPVVTASSTVVAAGTLGTSQSVTLSGLTASTTYFYVVDAKDASNNVATSAQQLFVTTN